MDNNTPDPAAPQSDNPPAEPATVPTTKPALTPSTESSSLGAVAAAPAAPEPVVAEPATQVNAGSAVVGGSMSSESAVKSGKKLLSIPILGILIALVLGGGGAAAYFGYYVPNKPENKLAAAFTGLLSQKQLSVTGSVEYTGDDYGVNVDYKADINTESNQYGVNGKVGVSGMSFPYDIRYIDKNVYLKAGGLESLASLAGESYGSILKKVNNQWYVIDKSFWTSLGTETSCVTDLSFALTDADIKIIQSSYEKHPLVTIKNTTSSKVDGENTTKYELEPSSDKEFNAFVNGLNDVSVIKNAKECAKKTGTEDTIDEEIKPFTGGESSATGTLTVYVNAKKQLKKIEITSKEDGVTTKVSSTFSYKNVTVTKPEGAKPLQDLIGDFFGEDFQMPTTEGLQGSAKDTERETDIKSIYAQLEAYYAENGYYPTLANLNSSAFVTANLKGLSSEALKDPDGTSSMFAGSPQKNTYSYAPTPAGCTNTGGNECTDYTLTAILGDGTAYTKKSLNGSY